MAQTSGKKEKVRQMFDNIAWKYDFLNHFLSAGIDHSWRKKLVKIIAERHPEKVLDVATGTADLAIALTRHSEASVVGIDISQGMLDLGVKKVSKRNLAERIKLQWADSEHLPFSDACFDACMVAFGVRNFEDLDRGLSEMHRVLSPGGMIAVLEFSKPRRFPVKHLYMFYFKHILPLMGKLVSKDRAAYTYLPESVEAFPDGAAFIAHLQKAGFVQCHERRLSFGIATIYSGLKLN